MALSNKFAPCDKMFTFFNHISISGVGKLFGSRASKLKKFLSRAGWSQKNSAAGRMVQEHSDQSYKDFFHL
jgi:hypothetical protein